MTARAQRPRLMRAPLSRPLNVTRVPDSGLDVSFAASADERAAIAADTDLPGVRSLSAAFHVSPRAAGVFAVTGVVEAEITQGCVVTLDTFDSVIEQPVKLVFAPLAEAREEHQTPGPSRRGRHVAERAAPPRVIAAGVVEDSPDPIIDDMIDLGAVAVEFLTLARDPYPRKPGVHFDDVVVGEGKEPNPSAFAALGRLKDRL